MCDLSNLPTLMLKNRHRCLVMRIVHVVESNLYILLPKGVYLNYVANRNSHPRINIRWGVKGTGQDYSYSHSSIDGLMKMYLTQIRSPVSIEKSGLFTENGLIHVSSKTIPIDPREVFKTYNTELEAILAMRRLLRLSNRDIDVKEMLSAQWVNLKELL